MHRFIITSIAFFIFAAPAAASDASIFSEMEWLSDFFGEGRADIVEISPPSEMPIPKGETKNAAPWWKSIPELPTSPQDGGWDAPRIEGVPIEGGNKFGDVLKEMQSCQSVDYVYARQPSTKEVVAALSSCLTDLSKRYGVKITAAEGTHGVVIMISGLIPPGSTVKSDLESSFQLRDGKLFGHTVSLIDLERPASDRQSSSLQPIVDQCGIESKSLKNAAAFVTVYETCLRSAKGTVITGVRADAKDETLVLVYSRDAKHLIRDMNGIVRILTEEGATRLRVQGLSDLLTDHMLRGKAVVPVSLRQ
ncbi:MAG: hypothetical protein COB53_02405 [Elusimicrobia bacterium]|nr:MAG: hypothetical protein COB53_02405 [Elusimicrobiota bacterium]